MKKLVLFVLFLCLSGPSFAATDCDVWLGTWDVTKEDGSTCVWVVDEIITGTSSNIPCQAVGTSTPSEGGTSTPFQIIQVSFYPNFVYTESKQLGEEQDSHELLINAAGDAFESGTVFTDYDLASGVKRLSGPRCGGLEPSFASAGETGIALTINGTETSFDNATTTVTIDCTEVELISYSVVSANEIAAMIDIADDADDASCAVSVTTGTEEILCSFEVRGAGDPERIIWEFETGNLVSSSPAISGNNVYFGSGDKKVYCLDAETGTTIWEFETGNVVLSSPAVSGGYVYIGSNDFKVYCLDAATGTKVWEYETEEAVQSSPSLWGGYLYIGGYDDKIYCLDAATGTKVWDYTTTQDVFSTPAVVDGKVYIGGVDYFLYCLDAKTGSLLWSYETGGDIPPSPAVADGRVFFGSKDHSFYCVDTETGKKIWSYETGDICFNSPAVYEDFVYFGSLDKSLYCVNVEDGSLAWQFTASGIIQSSPTVTDDYVYVGSSDKNLYCLEARTGRKLWNFKTGDIVVSSPSLVDGRLYVGSYDNTFYCLKAPDDEKESWPMFRYNLTRTGAPGTTLCPTAAALGTDAPAVATLRQFRDRVLAKTALGNVFIETYYDLAPLVEKACRAYPACRTAATTTLTSIMPLIDTLVRNAR